MSFDIQQFLGPIVSSLENYGPKVLGALIILIVAWVIGKLVAMGVSGLVNRTALGRNSADAGSSIGKAAFWIIMLIALPMILGRLGLTQIMEPLNAMTEKFLAFLPQLIGAALIFTVGMIVAKVVRTALESILQAAQVDNLASRYGLANITGEGGTSIARVVGLVAFTVIIVPVAIAALNKLGIKEIAGPATQMLESFMGAIPNILTAAVILLISFIFSRFASTMIASVLPATGIDNVAKKSVLGEFIGSKQKPSELVGKLTAIAIMIFGTIEAANMLKFEILSNMLSTVLALGGKILLGTVIIAFGVFAAGIVGKLVSNAAGKNSAMPGLVKFAVILLATAMGLRQMGVANEIVTNGFTAMIAAVGVGSAIAIGLGGQDTAKKLLGKWTKNL